MKAIFPFLSAVLASFALASPMPEKGETLAVNTVIAAYDSTVDRPCYFRTANCPDRCGHATRVAKFRVLKNEHYEKPGKYGDDKAEAGDALFVDVLHDVPGQDESVAKDIASLRPGDAVRMTVTHFYVNDHGNRYPIRPVTSFERVEKSADAPQLPAEDTNFQRITPLWQKS